MTSYDDYQGPRNDLPNQYNLRASNDYASIVNYADSTPLTHVVRRLGYGESHQDIDPPEFRRDEMELSSLHAPSSSGIQADHFKTHSRLPKDNIRHRWSQWVINAWIFELLSLLVSAVCLVGIVLTLSLHDGNPLPRWPFSISINALISALSTISKSALLVAVTAAISQRKWARLLKGNQRLYDLEVYDEASRGPWGSVSLLLSTGWSDLASLGALITVLSLAMDPFMQQITSFESAPQVIGTTNISARVIFETGVNQSGQVFPYGFAQNPASFRPLATQSLYFDGNLSDPFISNALQLRPESSGGNVSFGSVETLAVGYECADITGHLPAPEQCSSDNNECCTPSYEEYDCDTKWRWSLPNDASTGWTRVGERSTLVITTNSSVPPLEVENSGRLTILNLTTIVPGWVDYANKAPWAKGTFGAAQECSLYWCVNNYDTKLSGGILSENLTSSFDQGYMSEDPDHTFFYIEPPGSNSSYHRADSMTYGNYTNQWINGSFLVNTEANTLLANYVADLLEGYATSLGYYDPGAAISSNPSLLRLYEKVEWDSNDKIHFDMEGIFEAMAQGMTTAVRKADITHPDDDAVLAVNGAETAMEVIVKVNWEWIILPVFLQVAANIFVFAVLIASRAKYFSTWKSSALAVMFFGMDVADKVPHDGVQTLGEMKNIAQNH
ncbi:hypothetical protein BJ166DRAFT_273711 [Pestalotiopsis sp. NC0098]|nr:hypothetical protein BJ166DRAFT_273711 [Pestalotiopsis sp. NC0098]